MSFKLSYYTTITQEINPNSDKPTHIAFSARTGMAMLVEKSTLESIENKQFGNISQDLLLKMFESEMLVNDSEDELLTVINEFKIGQSSNDTLSMVITPTANCQLGCNYCGQVHSKVNMSEVLTDKILAHIKNKLDNKTYSALDITWYGSEPLMGYSSLKSLSDKLIELCKERQLTYSSSMITNGLSLKKKVFEDLVTKYHCTNFQITLDGIKETHDNSRMTKSGVGTFDKILDNVVNATKHPYYNEHKCLITIRVNVQKNNYNEVDDLIELLCSLGIQNKVIVDLVPIHDWGNNNADESIGIDKDLFASKEIDWLIKLKKLGFRLSGYLPSRRYGTCMTTTFDSELIDANGDVSYCWEVPYTEGLEKDRELVVGNVSDNKVYTGDHTQAPLRHWYDDILNGLNNSENCKSCKLLPACGGHCPISWYKGKRACPTFKFNLEDKLILKYLDGKIEF